MDDAFFDAWFFGFVEGIESLSAPARTVLLSACARRCAETGPLARYRALFLETGGDPDAFFPALDRLDDARGAVVEPGREYEVRFPRCGCDLVTRGYVHTPRLCECSRLSILHALGTLWPGERFRVERLETILEGAKSCRFRVLRDGAIGA